MKFCSVIVFALLVFFVWTMEAVAVPGELQQLEGELITEASARNEWNALFTAVQANSFPPRANSEIKSRIGKLVMFRGIIAERESNAFVVKAVANSLVKVPQPERFLRVRVLGPPPADNSDTVLVSVIGEIKDYTGGEIVVKAKRTDVVAAQ